MQGQRQNWTGGDLGMFARTFGESSTNRDLGAVMVSCSQSN